MSIPHPFPYQGSKRKIATQILQYFPEHVERLVEPFGGSGALTLATASQRKADYFHLNDVNQPLIDLWKAIVENPTALAEKYAELWHAQLGQEKATYFQIRAKFNDSHQPEQLLYLLMRCVKASIRYNSMGEFNQSPDNRRKGMQPGTVKSMLTATAYLLKNKIQFSALDYQALLQKTSTSDLVYMDPPYQGVEGRNPRYLETINFAQFVEALDDLNRRGIAYIVSYDGRTGNKTYGKPLPTELELTHIEIDAGRSTQATLLGESARTYEALYLSKALYKKINIQPIRQLQLC